MNKKTYLLGYLLSSVCLIILVSIISVGLYAGLQSAINVSDGTLDSGKLSLFGASTPVFVIFMCLGMWVVYVIITLRDEVDAPGDLQLMSFICINFFIILVYSLLLITVAGMSHTNVYAAFILHVSASLSLSLFLLFLSVMFFMVPYMYLLRLWRFKEKYGNQALNNTILSVMIFLTLTFGMDLLFI